MTYATLEKQIRALPEECLDEVSGGQKVYDYYHKQRKSSCGCEDFTCLGWDDAKHGYNYKCNACGETMFSIIWLETR